MPNILIQNPGFESPVLGTYQHVSNPSNADWEFSGSGIAQNGSVPTGSIRPAPEGSQVGYLPWQGSFIQQTLTGFQIGVQYEVLFQARRKEGNTQTIDVAFDANLLTNFSLTDEYAEYTTPLFTATASTHVLKFSGAISGDNTALIDAVVVRSVGGNQPPTVNAGADQNLPSGTTQTTLTGTASDPDGDALEHEWTLLSGPNTPTIVSPTALSTQISGLMAGTYVFRLTTSDGINPAVTDDVSVTVASTSPSAPRGIVLASGVAGGTWFPASAPFNSLGAFEFSARIRNLASMSSGANDFALHLKGNGTYGSLLRVQWHGGSSQLDVYVHQGYGPDNLFNLRHIPANINDFILTLKFEPGSNRFRVETTNADQVTGKVTTDFALLDTTTNWAMTQMTLNGANLAAGTTGLSCDYALLKQLPSETKVFEYLFDSDTGADTSGNNNSLTFVGVPSYEDTPVIPPGKPTGLLTSVLADTRVALYLLSSSARATALEIQRSPVDVTNWITIASPAPPPLGAIAVKIYEDITASANTRYKYRVRGVDAVSAGEWSNEMEAFTLVAGAFIATLIAFNADARVDVGERIQFSCEAIDSTGNSVYGFVPEWEVIDLVGGAIKGEFRYLDDWTSNWSRQNTYGSPNDFTLHNRIVDFWGLAPGTVGIRANCNGIQTTVPNCRVADPAAPVTINLAGDVTNATTAINLKECEMLYVDLRGCDGLFDWEYRWGDTAWIPGNPDTTTEGHTALHVYAVAGTYNFRVRVKNATGQEKFHPPLDQPAIQVVVTQHTADVAPTQTFNVSDRAQLYAVIPQCTGGEKIRMAAGVWAQTAENMQLGINLGFGPLTDYVVLETTGVLPSDIRNRVSADSPELCTLGGYSINDPAMVIPDGRGKIVLRGLKFTTPSQGVGQYGGTYTGLVIGSASLSPYIHRPAGNEAHHIVLQHCAVDSPDEKNMVHAIENDGYRVSMVSCDFQNAKLNGGDSQAVSTASTRGLHGYLNCFFEGAGQGYLTGGTFTAFGVNCRTNEWRRCDIYKRFPVTLFWTLKTLWELKGGIDYFLEGCTFRNLNNNAFGEAIVLKSSNQGLDFAGNLCERVRLENCLLQGISGGAATTNDIYPALTDRYSQSAALKPRHISWRNVLFKEISSALYGPSGLLCGLAYVDYWDMQFCTSVQNGGNGDQIFETRNNYGYKYRNNIATTQIRIGGDVSSATPGIQALDAGTGGDNGTPFWEVAKNVLPGLSTTGYGAHPTGNAYPATIADILLVNPSAGNFRLQPSSPYIGYGDNGRNPGLDQDLLELRTLHTIDGQWFSTANQLPTVNAGADQNLPAVTTQTTLTGTASDPDGGAVTVVWTRQSGPNTPTIVSPTALSTQIIDLEAGTYVFRLMATDDESSTAFDDVQIVVAAAANQPPTVTAGADQNLPAGTTQANLDGTASDPDGDALTFAWSRVSGPNTPTFTTPNAVDTTVTGLVGGTYAFRLAVSDGVNPAVTDDVQIVVAATANQPPTCALTSPTNGAQFNQGVIINLVATASDSDGTIAKVEFYNGATKLGEDTTTPYSLFFNPSVGAHNLKARAFDDDGAFTDSAVATITVTVAPPPPPTGLTAARVGNHRLDVSWTDTNAGAASHIVEYSLDGATWTTLPTLEPGVNAASITGLQMGALYYLRCRATNANGNSGNIQISRVLTGINFFGPNEPPLAG